MPKKKSCCPILLLSTRQLSLNLPLISLSVRDHIEYEFVAKKEKVKLWRGVVVSTDPDAERRTGSVPNKQETTSKQARCRRTTTKEASHLNTTDSDTAECHTAATLLFENWSSTKGKQPKVTAVRHHQVQEQSGNVVGVLLFVNLCLIAL